MLIKFVDPFWFGLRTVILGAQDGLSRWNPGTEILPWLKSLLRHEERTTMTSPTRCHSKAVSLWPQTCTWGCTRFMGASLGPDPSHPTSPGPHPDVGEHWAGSKPADCWGQQNHSLKQEMLRGGRTSWVSASAHSTLPSQPHTPQLRASLGALGRHKLPAPSPGLPGIAPLSKALLGATCPSHTGWKSQQEHKTSLPRFPLSAKGPKTTPLLKVCSPRGLRSPGETMMVKARIAEHCFYLFCSVCSMRNSGEAMKKQGKPCGVHEEIPWFSIMQGVLCGPQTISPKSSTCSSVSGAGSEAGREQNLVGKEQGTG